MNGTFHRDQGPAGRRPSPANGRPLARGGVSAWIGTARSWWWILVMALAAMIVPVRAVAEDSTAAIEYKVKAGYLFNFAKFIEWPDSALPAADSLFVIGVLDGGEAFPVLQSLLEGKQVNGRTVKVKAVSAAAVGKDIHILLVTRASGKSPVEVQAALGGAATLLVGETEQFAERGGMVGFVREDEAIRLTLNLERAAEAGLKVSAKLSTVARVVKSKRAN